MWSVTTNDVEKLILVKSDENLSFINIQMLLHQIYLQNGNNSSAYNRFVDLSELKKIDTNLDSLRDHIRWYRKVHLADDTVKMVAYLPYGIIRSIIEIYEQEAKEVGIKIKVSGSLDECATYLSVDRALLQL